MLTEKHIAYLTTRNGWATPEKMTRLYDLATEVSTDKRPCIVELGVFAGRSLFPMALAFKDAGRGLVYGVETWDNITPLEGENSKENDEWWGRVNMDFIKAEFFKSVNFLALGNYVEAIKAKTYDAAVRFDDGTISIIHQDSAHNEEVITKELDAWSSKVRIGGYWVTDDDDWKETETGYAKLPSYGFEKIEDYGKWSIYKKVR